MAKKTYTLKVTTTHGYYGYDENKSERICVGASTVEEDRDADDYVYKEPEDQLTLSFSGLASNWPFDDLGDTITVTLGS